MFDLVGVIGTDLLISSLQCYVLLLLALQDYFLFLLLDSTHLGLLNDIAISFTAYKNGKRFHLEQNIIATIQIVELSNNVSVSIFIESSLSILQFHIALDVDLFQPL